MSIDPNDGGSRSADFDMFRGIPGVERVIDSVEHTGMDVWTALSRIDCEASRFFFHQADRVYQAGSSSTTPSSNMYTPYTNTEIGADGKTNVTSGYTNKSNV